MNKKENINISLKYKDKGNQMSDADKLILNELSHGRSVQVVPRGNSMYPRIKEGDTIMIAPLLNYVLKKGDIVLCRINHNRFITHQILDINNQQLVTKVKTDDNDITYTIANQSGKIDGHVTLDAIYGIVTDIYEASNVSKSFDGLTVIE